VADGAKKIDFASELAIGKPNSLGNTLTVVKAVESNSRLFPQLLKLLMHEDSIVAMRAMNATKRLMRADKNYFDPQKEALVKVFSKSKHNVVRLGLITLYFDFIKEFSPAELKSIKTLTLKWMNETEDWMILAHGLKLLEKLAKIDPKIHLEVIALAKAFRKIRGRLYQPRPRKFYPAYRAILLFKST